MTDDFASATGSALGDAGQNPLHRGLKAVVILLGVLIVIALAVLVAGLILRGAGKGQGGHGAPTLALPPGAQIVSLDVSDNRLILRIKTDGGEEVDIVDTSDGHLVGRVRTVAALP